MRPAGIIELYSQKRIKLYAQSIAARPETTQAFKELADGTGGNCTVAVQAREAVAATHHTLDVTSSLVTASRTYATAVVDLEAAGVPVSIDSVSAHLGWSPAVTAGTAAYLDGRGIRISSYNSSAEAPPIVRTSAS
jgi:hypothetical protein